MNRAIARAARKAKQFAGSTLPINWTAVMAHEEALHSMERPTLCPCCSFLWDKAEAECVMQIGPEAYRAWLHRTLALPANEVGDDLGQRGEPATLADFE